MDRFWRTRQGELIRFRRRREESLRLSLPLEPPTKRTRPSTRAKARAALTEAFATDVLAQRAREVTAWPRPRAPIALDVYLSSDNRNGARVDGICKWLLDELSGLVYADDRQVKMLFASAARPYPLPRLSASSDAANDPWTQSVLSELPEGFELVRAENMEPSRRPRSSELYITAQTKANVLADLRAVSSLDQRWDPFDDEYGLPRIDPVRASFQRDELVDYHAIFDANSDRDVLQRRLVGGQIDYHDQSQQQSVVDLVFSSLFTDLQVDKFGIWDRVRGRIAFAPYIFDVGVLPGRGEKAQFLQRFRAQLEERSALWPSLFPMRARSGISMIVFEDAGHGKDLDNLIRTLLPDILEVLRPQQHDLHGWVADEADPDKGEPTIPFIEVAAVPATVSDMPPGSVVFGLSTADRFDSWWHLATEHLERVLKEGEDGYWS